LTSDRVILGFLLTVVVQYIGMAVAWVGLGKAWYAARGVEVADENQLNLPALFDFATYANDAGSTGASFNLALGTANFIVGSAVIVLLANIGSVLGPANSDPGRKSDQTKTDDRLGLSPTQDLVLQVFDQKFSPQGIAESTWVNTSLIAGFFAVWFVFSMLPETKTSRRGKRDTRESTHSEDSSIDWSHHRGDNSIVRSLVMLHSATLRIESL